MHVKSRAFGLHAGGVLALLVAALTFQYLVNGVLVGSIVDTNGVPGWLPAFGTIGETVTVYLLVGEVVSQLLVPLAIAYVGYRYGRLEADGPAGA